MIRRRRGMPEPDKGSSGFFVGVAVGVALVVLGVVAFVLSQGRDSSREAPREASPSSSTHREDVARRKQEIAERRQQAGRALEEGARAPERAAQESEQAPRAPSPSTRPKLPETPEEEEAFVTAEAKRRLAGFVRTVRAQGAEIADADLQGALDHEKQVVRRTLESMRRVVRVGLANGFSDREIQAAFNRACDTVLSMPGANGSLGGGISDEDAVALEFLQRARREGSADAQLDRLK